MSPFAEHPDLSPESLAAIKAASIANGFEDPNVSFANCRSLAAFLKEAMAQASAHPYGNWAKLAGIADNLHSPPPPPTLAEAREAARQLAGQEAAVVHAFLATLQEAEQ